MIMKSNKKLIMIIILGVWMLNVLLGCNHNDTVDPDNNMYVPGRYMVEVADYILSGTEEGYYIIMLDDYSSAEAGVLGQMTSELRFDSMKSFADAVTKGTLTNSQKYVISTFFPNDEKGVLTCDFENLQQAHLPQNFVYTEIIWSGESYTHVFSSDRNESEFGNISVYPKHTYDEIFQRDYVNRYDDSDVVVTKTEMLNERNAVAVYYKTNRAKMMSIQYTLQSDNTVYIVEEDYAIEAPSMAEEWVSETVPYRIKMYCTDGNNCFVVRIYHPISRPTEEWLLSFGLTKFVSSNTIGQDTDQK